MNKTYSKLSKLNFSLQKTLISTTRFFSLCSLPQCPTNFYPEVILPQGASHFGRHTGLDEIFWRAGHFYIIENNLLKW